MPTGGSRLAQWPEGAVMSDGAVIHAGAANRIVALHVVVKSYCLKLTVTPTVLGRNVKLFCCTEDGTAPALV